MNKAKIIASAIAALGAVSAQAAFLDATTLAPEAVFYVSGASAQKPGVQAIAPSAIFFDTTSFAVAAITSSLVKDSTNFSNPTNFPQGSLAWYGIGQSGLTDSAGNDVGGKRLLIIQSSANGSAAGINQVISTGTPTEAESNVVYVGPSMGCVVNVVSSVTVGYKCSGYTHVESDLALSDVYIGEFPAGAVVGDPSGLTEYPTMGMEGFGVIASPNAYRALQVQNVASGELDPTCTASGSEAAPITTAACQPTLSRTNYFNAIATAGTKHSAAALLGKGAGDKLSIYRRVDTSGSQAANTIYFLNKPCADLTGKSYTPNVATGTPGVSTYAVVAGSQTDDVITGVKSATGTNYALGVVSLEKTDASLGSALYVKLNGVSPNYDSATGAADSTHRKALLDGRYEFQVEMAAYSAYDMSAGSGTLGEAFLAKLNDPALSNNTGYAYQQGTFTAGKSTKLSRNGGGNCDALQ